MALPPMTPNKKVMQPFNLGLYSPSDLELKFLQEVTSLDTTDGPGGNFHEDGLFSTRIFGRVGDPFRDKTFGYIDLRVPVFHPVILRTLIKLKGFYGDIMAGRTFVVWNDTTKEFDKSNELEGKTGLSYFMHYWDQIEFEKNNSHIRNLRIDLLNKYKSQALVKHLMVMPAGLRDAEIDADGRMSMDEINEFYQGVLILTRNYPEHINPKEDLSIYDRTRYGIMMKFSGIYDHIENLLSGKGGFIQSRWASRRVFNGTRNVISSLDTSTADLDAPNRPGFNSTVVGLYQASVAIKPKVIYGLKQSLISDIFDTGSNRVRLVNKESLELEWVDISNEEMDVWATDQGLEQVVDTISEIERRTQAVEVANHYLALIYLDDKENFKILRDIQELPPELDAKRVRPITWCELIYLTNLDVWNKVSAFVTRYPIENLNSSYPSKQYVRTTVKAELRHELGYDWERTGRLALEYPIFQLGKIAQFHDSTSVSSARLGGLGADFDGDTISYLAVYSDDAIEETDKFFGSRSAYIQATGGLSASVAIDTLDLTLRFITGNPTS